jgi:hypothetical protein
MDATRQALDSLGKTAGIGGIFAVPDLEDTRQVFDDHREIAENAVKLFRQRVTSTGVPDICFDFMNSPQLNAMAAVLDRQGFVGVASGAVYLIGDMFSRMLRCPTVFSWVGNPDLETAPPPSH